jgi:hypothetical protein
MVKIVAPLVVVACLAGSSCGANDSVSSLFAPGQVPDRCDGEVYFVVAAATCSCAGEVAYALCEGGQYLDCTCSVPCGFVAACPTKNGLSVFCEAGTEEAGIPIGDAACMPDGEQ